MTRRDKVTEAVQLGLAITGVLVFLRVIALGTPTVPVTCAQGGCSCATVTAQAATVEHQATVIARLWNDGVASRATIEAVRATGCPPLPTRTTLAMPWVLR